ncbi:putative RNA-directed DNA polymerase from transposon X-element [Araneus ventricosus]|uniref:Putative RNA-directed DNA polymerase from transposon X-element n=1 Tax=Araneus ventricosus TaxID=182803 RepID=A0A4Y2PF66_ARAVE|nr:putative RNA-directed DNA polymerase from transposon X-element [Araneus ventricosus]
MSSAAPTSPWRCTAKTRSEAQLCHSASKKFLSVVGASHFRCAFNVSSESEALSLCASHITIIEGTTRLCLIFKRYTFKSVSENLCSILTLFNRIWNEKAFPASWREAVVVPIPKPGKDPQNSSNYRPIALTSCLCKLLERMVNKRLVYILEKKNILSKFQSGFRYGRSSQDNVLQLEIAIRDAFVSKKHLVSIFFDMDKAYDRAWRHGILKDLFNIGLRDNLPIFIKNFLLTRTFRVRVGDVLSDEFYQQEGAPQGSVLSVTLFILKINDIIKQLSPYVHGSLYVDDFQIHCSGTDMSFVERQICLPFCHQQDN